MRGLKKRNNAEFTQRQATPISLDMLRVLHSHLASAEGFTEASRLWFTAVSAFAFYSMCRMNEVLSLQWKILTLGLTRQSVSDHTSSISYASYKLEGRKTEVAEGRCYHLHHLDEGVRPIEALYHVKAWLEYIQTKTDHRWSDTDYVFPALSKISKNVLKADTASTGCENARLEWGKKMSEPAFISDENKQLADCLAPDREGHTGCSTAFTGRKRNVASNFKKTSTEASLEKRLKALDNSTNALEEKMNTQIAIHQPGMVSTPEPSCDQYDCSELVSIILQQKIGTIVSNVLEGGSVSSFIQADMRVEPSRQHE
ncbi:unnamed protein product [Phytophthora fragariaefolia]|uniref:Unnamed protein product n=1 Tax=Phytophthora fragariaefolia TaxID=1490495 RepID=A0A9W7CPG4_9STRA|nr:unnamed protein product [Phytophthora fragariaefolia]